MKIALCQISPKVGDLEGNFLTIESHYKQAQNQKADICLFPELSVSGYFAGDLFLKKSFINDILATNFKLIKNTGGTCMLLPTVSLKDGKLYNAVIAAQNGKIIGITYKNNLANYGVFDEKRYFDPGKSNVIQVGRAKIGVPICADLWYPDVTKELKNQGAELFLVPNGSTYDVEKTKNRLANAQDRFKETDIPIIYCNQVLAHDGIIFDGKSFCFDGEFKFVGKSFLPDYQIIEFNKNKLHPERSYPMIKEQNADIFNALVLGVRTYLKSNGFSKVVLGLSGGIDSAIVAVIASFAVGSKNVFAYMLPSKFTSENSQVDAINFAKRLVIKLETISINDILDSFCNNLDKKGKIQEGSITHQNLQSRIRGTILMAKSNDLGAMLLTTGNKSEYATGYATIYGDMNGGFNPIKDLYKTDIYKLAEYINLHHNNIIPQNIIDKKPSAELFFKQTDEDNLPEYSVLDQILRHYIENDESCHELSQKFDPSLVKKVIELVKKSEFKRKQSAPGVKISIKNFEKDRRYPTTQYYQ